MHRYFLLILSALLVFFPVAQAASVLTADVAVIGAGGAGLSAALEARLLGARVIVLEKMPAVGGNTLLAAGGLSVPGSPQAAARYLSTGGAPSGLDNAAIGTADTMRSGEYRNDPALARLLNEQARAALDWLGALGGDFRHVTLAADASKARLHRPAAGRFAGLAGPELIRTLYREAHARGVTIRTSSEVTAILRDAEGRVSGVSVKTPEGALIVRAPAVVNAAGGFAASAEAVHRVAPHLAKLASTNAPGATGDGIRLARALGAATRDMTAIDIVPTVLADSKDIVPEHLRRRGALLVNRRGARFVDELASDLTVATAIRRLPEQRAWLVFDETVAKAVRLDERFGASESRFRAATPDALATLTGIDPEGLAATLAGLDPATALPEPALSRSLTRAPFYAFEVIPARHHTAGGLMIDSQTRVLDARGKPVPGLFAAGEVTGGVHGLRHQIGNALTEAVVFGRIAGREAAVSALANTVPRSPDRIMH